MSPRIANLPFDREFTYIDKARLKNPGPGYYQSPDPKKPKGTSGIAFPKSKDFHSSYLRKDPGPGPADYKTELITPQKGLRFKTEGLNILQKSAKEFIIPGPGFYSSKPDVILNRFLNKPPAFTFRKARSQTPRNKNPGPMDYTPLKPARHSPKAFFGSEVKKVNLGTPFRKNEESDKTPIKEEKKGTGIKKIKGLAFSNEKRVFEFGEVSKLRNNLGPGEYHTKIEEIRGKSPGGGFGKSDRAIRIKRSPGPGDYL